MEGQFYDTVEADRFEVMIYGNPVAQPRHRTAPIINRDGNVVRTKDGRVMMTQYNPTKTASGKAHPILRWRQVIHLVGQEVIRRGFVPVREHRPLTLEVHFYFERPKGKPKKEGMNHTVKPDCDNLIKALKDAWATVLFHDDRQIDREIVEKEYVLSAPGIRVKMYHSAFKAYPEKTG